MDALPAASPLQIALLRGLHATRDGWGFALGGSREMARARRATRRETQIADLVGRTSLH